MVHENFDKTSAAKHKGTGINSDVASENQQLAEELHKFSDREFEI